MASNENQNDEEDLAAREALNSLELKLSTFDLEDEELKRALDTLRNLENDLRDRDLSEYLIRMDNWSRRARELREREAARDAVEEFEIGRKVFYDLAVKERKYRCQDFAVLKVYERLQNEEFELIKTIINFYSSQYTELLQSHLLYKAMQEKNINLIQSLIEIGECLNYVTEREDISTLHLATRLGRIDIIRFFIQRKHFFRINVAIEKQYDEKPLDFKSGDKMLSLLHVASLHGQKETLRFLIDKGACIDNCGKDDVTPLHLTILEGKNEEAQILIEKGANLSMTTKLEGLTPLHIACNLKNFNIIRCIVMRNHSQSFSVDLFLIEDKSGMNPFHCLCHKSASKEIIGRVCEWQPNISNSRSGNLGQFPIHFACRQKNSAVVKILLMYGAEIDGQDENGFTALHIACESDDEEMVKLLLQRNANTRMEDNQGFYPSELCHSDEVKHLISNSSILPFYWFSTGRTRGYCLIINNQKFHNPANNRDGSNHDRDKLKTTFQNCGYKVIVHNDLMAHEILIKLQEFVRKLTDKHDSVVVCLLSHGKNNSIYGVDGNEFHYRKYIIEELGPGRARAMIGKPKICIIQACRGNRQDVGHQVDFIQESHFIPTQSDFLFCHSTVKDFVAYRNPASGSVFIQALCKFIDMYHREDDVLQILTRVNATIVKEEFPIENQMIYKSTCEFVSRLTKLFKF